MRARPCYWGNLAIMKTYFVKPSDISYKKSYRTCTPLMNINIMNGFRPNNLPPTFKKTFFILHYPFNRPAYRSKIINQCRQTFYNKLNSYTHKFPPHFCVRVTLLPPCQLVSNPELEDHFTKVLDQFLFHKSRFGANTVRTERMEDIQESLFPWNPQLWNQVLQSNLDLRGYSSVSYLKGIEIYSVKKIRPSWIISHYYQINNSRDQPDFLSDMKQILAVLHKFNFFQFFSQDKISGQRRQKAEALSHKLIRLFEWKTKESQIYLIYLSRSYGPQNLLQVLEDFESVSQIYHYQK